MWGLGISFWSLKNFVSSCVQGFDFRALIKGGLRVQGLRA